MLHKAPRNISEPIINRLITRLTLGFQGEFPCEDLPAAFAKVRGATNIRFVLAKSDPAGYDDDGINTYPSKGPTPTAEEISSVLWNKDEYINLVFANDVKDLANGKNDGF